MPDPTFTADQWARVKKTPGVVGRVIRVYPRIKSSVLLAINGDDMCAKAYRPDELEHCPQPAKYGAAALGQP